MPTHPDSEEEAFYEHIAQEIGRGEIRPGLWLKANVDAEGEEKRAWALYAKYRLTQFKRETQWLREAATAELHSEREVFIYTMAQKGFAIAESDGAWILYAPDGNATRFSSFEECRHHFQAALDSKVP